MRTDDFEDIHPEDPSEPRPDKQAEFEGEDFNEFDQPAKAGGTSLGDVWRNNPLIKIAVVVIGLVVAVSAYAMFGGGNAKDPTSRVGPAVQATDIPGGPTTPAYSNAIEEENQKRIEQARLQGTSSIPIPTAGTQIDTSQVTLEEPPVTLEDPLADWRTSIQQPVEGAPNQQVQQPTMAPYQPSQQQQPQQPLGPDPQAVDALGQAMAQQMGNILAKHAITGPQVMAVTDKSFMDKQNAGASPASVATDLPVEVEEILIPAGTIVYAQTMTEANSDVPGPVLARISSGPLAGSRILGSFQRREEKLVLTFNRVVIKGVDYGIDGIALDPKTTLPAVATDVDRRYWKRFIFPAAARFIEGMGDAIANREQTNVSVNGSTVTSSKPDLNTTEEIAAGFAEGTSSIADDLDDEGNVTQPLVRVRAGTPIGILFLEPVIDQE